MSSHTTLLGAAGEHYVMSQLLRRGLIAALAPQGVPMADIVVTDLGGDRLCSVQVKSRRDIGSDKGWHFQPKHASNPPARLFYCLVDFGKSERDHPTIYVMPSAKIAEVLTATYAMARNARKKGSGTQRDDCATTYSRLLEGVR
jgi:hypothetical protein